MRDTRWTIGTRGARDPLESYLDELRAGLRGLPPEEIEEIIVELRSHVHDSVGSAGPASAEVGTALRNLGSPSELSALYLIDRILERAERTWSPWFLLRGLFRWAGRSLAGFLLLLLLVAGYTIAVSLLLAALIKPLAPERVGLWLLEGGEVSLRLGFGSPVAGQELLGWWIVPLGAAAGVLGFLLATFLVRRGIRRYRPLVTPGRRAP